MQLNAFWYLPRLRLEVSKNAASAEAPTKGAAQGDMYLSASLLNMAPVPAILGAGADSGTCSRSVTLKASSGRSQGTTALGPRGARGAATTSCCVWAATDGARARNACHKAPPPMEP